MIRPERLRFVAAALAALVATPAGAAGPVLRPVTALAQADPSFQSVLAELRQRAEAAGISAATLAEAFRTLDGPDATIVAQTRRQSEFSQPIGAYVEGAANPGRVATARKLAARWSGVLSAIETRYRVPREILLAVWGMESAFGANPGNLPVLRSLATLTFLGNRRELFRDEFIAALRILEAERIRPDELTGSWAGALGQVQFMPSAFLNAAVDQDGDGHRDIWHSVPDSLASIANLLVRSGWRPGLPPAFEVRLPDKLDLSLHQRPLADWAARGVTRPDGTSMPEGKEARLFLPAGIKGPAFLITENFEALRAYNTSDAYALGVARLADAIAGRPALARPWPKAPVLNADERRELQERLARLGLYADTPDGRLGAKTRDAVRRFQIQQGLVPDGYADRTVLETLRRAR